MQKTWRTDKVRLKMRKIVVSRKGDNVGSLSERLWRKAKNNDEYMAFLLFLKWTLDYMEQNKMLYNPWLGDC
jgi:hypothetical protein